jgi:hypothetical protein
MMDAESKVEWVKFSRRRFLKVGSVSLALIIVGILLFDFRKTVRRMLKRDTSQLNLSDNAITDFMADADREHYWRQFGLAKRALINVQDALNIVGIRTPWYGKYLKYRNEITGKLLFSTNLFERKYVVGDQIQYAGFHNPYKAPCGNPFSALRSA